MGARGEDWGRVIMGGGTKKGRPPPAWGLSAAAGTPSAAGRDVSRPGAGTSTADPATADTANAVTLQYGRYVVGYGDDQPPNAVQNYPNCHQPVAIINLLVTPAAA